MVIASTVAKTKGEASPVAGSQALRCVITRDCPHDWDALLKECDGGFFHAPLGAEVAAQDGEPVFVRIFAGSDIVGISAGVRRACRLSDIPRHVYFPTLPALAEGVSPRAALDALLQSFRHVEAAEVVMDSFDAHWSGDATATATEARPRDEYVVPLLSTADELMASLSSGHRRQIRKGDKGAWRLELPEGDDARTLLVQVQEVAASRAAARGSGFAVRVPRLQGLHNAGEHPWGATVFTAWRESTVLAAAMVGWANGRAFYVIGGSTPAGYDCGASVWLHWRIARQLSDAGFISYNLGGVSAAGASPGHPSHGLYRFKMGFGTRVVPCRSMHWTLSPSHARVHQLGRWLGNTLASQDT